MTASITLTVETSGKTGLYDITERIRQVVGNHAVDSGILVVYTPHTTAGITINENADPAVREDIMRFLADMVPHKAYFTHSEGNSPAHVMSSLVSASETLIIADGQLVLGRWQGVFFAEFDGPRSRTVLLKFIET